MPKLGLRVFDAAEVLHLRCESAARATMDWLANSAYYAIPGDAQWEMEPDEQAVRTLQQHFVTKQETKSGKVYAHSPRDPLLKKSKDLRQSRRVDFVNRSKRFVFGATQSGYLLNSVS